MGRKCPGKGSGSLSKLGRYNVRFPPVPCAASSPTSDRWHYSTTPGSSLHYSQATTIKMAGYDKYRLKLLMFSDLHWSQFGSESS